MPQKPFYKFLHSEGEDFCSRKFSEVLENAILKVVFRSVKMFCGKAEGSENASMRDGRLWGAVSENGGRKFLNGG